MQVELRIFCDENNCDNKNYKDVKNNPLSSFKYLSTTPVLFWAT